MHCRPAIRNRGPGTHTTAGGGWVISATSPADRRTQQRVGTHTRAATRPWRDRPFKGRRNTVESCLVVPSAVALGRRPAKDGARARGPTGLLLGGQRVEFRGGPRPSPTMPPRPPETELCATQHHPASPQRDDLRAVKLIEGDRVGPGRAPASMGGHCPHGLLEDPHNRDPDAATLHLLPCSVP